MDDWVQIPIIRLDKIEAMDMESPGVTITELSDDEPLDLTIKAEQVEIQSEPLDLTVTVEEPLVSSPMSERDVSPIVTTTEDNTEETHAIVSVEEVQFEEIKPEINSEVTFVNIPIQRSSTKPVSDVVRVIEDTSKEIVKDISIVDSGEIITTETPIKSYEDSTKEITIVKTEGETKEPTKAKETQNDTPVVIRKPPTPPASGKHKKAPPSRSQSLNMDQDKLVKAEAMQFQEALAKKGETDQTQRWSVNIPIIRSNKETTEKAAITAQSKEDILNEDANTQSNMEANAQATNVPEEIVVNDDNEQDTSNKPNAKEIATPTLAEDEQGFVIIPIKLEISDPMTDLSLGEDRPIPIETTSKEIDIDDVIAEEQSNDDANSIDVKNTIDLASSEPEKNVSEVQDTGDKDTEQKTADNTPKDATALPIATSRIMENTARSSSLTSSDITLKEQIITTQIGLESGSPDQIYLTIHSAKNLPKMDVVTAGDPYVIIKYGHTQFRSVTKSNTANPEWNFEVDLKLNNVDKEITITLYDEDKFSKDDIIGEFVLNVDDIINQETILNASAKLSKKGEIVYSATVLKQYSGHKDLALSVDGSVLNIPTSYNLPSGENITIAHAIQFPKGRIYL